MATVTPRTPSHVPPVLMISESLTTLLRHTIDQKTKPLGALGKLEDLALQIGSVLNTDRPVLTHPHVLVFAADHGVAGHQPVSAYPQAVTAQMVFNFLQGGAAINVFCQQHDMDLFVINAGVNIPHFDPHPMLWDTSAGKGTADYTRQPAMTEQELDACFRAGKTCVQKVAQRGCNVLGLGEMGIGNTSSASLILHLHGGDPLSDCVGRGTGVSDEGWERKVTILEKAATRHQNASSPQEILQAVGGFEIAQMTSAFLEAYEQNMLILVDGFIASSAFLMAQALNPHIRKNAVFCHLSEEKGHRLLLQTLGADPILNLNLRLGEGTGCPLAYPLLQSAVAFLNNMASFESAQVSGKSDS